MALPKVTRKKKVKLAPRRRKGAGLDDPSFENWEKLTPEKFHAHRRYATDFYYQNYKPADLMPFVWKWMKDNGYTKREIDSAKAGNVATPTLGIYAKLLLTGCPDYSKAHDEYWQSLAGTTGQVYPISEFLKAKIAKAIESGKDAIIKENEKKKEKYVPTIQERLMEAATEKTAELDEWVDDWLRDPKENPLKDKMPLTSFRKHEVNLGHTRWIQQWYNGEYEELTELINLPTPSKQDEMQKQLAEGYDHLTKKQQKELHGYYERIMQAIEILRAEKKQTRAVRKPKVRTAQELVKKLKFKSSEAQFGIASVNPSEIIDANTVVVFNCKNRKLGIYYAEDHSTLSVKGTTLQFFNEQLSVQKTIRKPDEVLPTWKKITKHKIKAQFGYLKTTETKLNGRFNEDTIILKVFK